MGAATYNDYNVSLTHYHRISDQFAFSTGGFYEHTGGFYQNSARNNERVDKGNAGGGRFRGIYLPKDNLKLDLNVSYEYSDQGGYPYFYTGITQEGVNVIMGCHMSVVTEVVAQVCQQYGIPMITAISTLDRLTDEDHKDYDYFFRLCPLNSVYVEDMLKYLQDSKEQTGNEIKKVAIFTDKAAIGQELIRCVNLFAPDYGLDVVAEVDYSSNATDLSSQVLALKQADPDAILCDSYIGDATLFVQTLKEQNYKPKMIVAKANGFTDPSFIPNLGASANGVASVVEFNPDLTNGVEINEDFKKVYNVNMNGHSAESYTVVWLFKTAIEKAGSTDGAAVRDALAELSIDGAFEGGRKIVLPYSKIEFAPEYEIGGAKHYRDNTFASVAIAQVQDQEWKTVWPFEFASSKIQEVTLG